MLNVIFSFLINGFNFLLLFVLPGYLILLLLKLKDIKSSEFYIYVPIISICVVLLLGLLVNTTSVLGVNEPLNKAIFLPVLTTFLFALSVATYRLQGKGILAIPKLQINSFSKSFISIALFSLTIGIIGTSVLNYSGNNVLVSISALYLFTYFLFVLLYRKQISEDAIPVIIYLFTLNAIALYSMRSWYVHGFDIHQELFVFNLTKSNFLWDIANFRDPYNACLSITILPTILSSIFDLDSNYIFKLLLPAIFSLMPSLLYLMFHKFTTSTKAFLAAMFFAVQGQFINQMPALLRQGVALTFFVFSLEVLFNERIERNRKNVLIAIAGTGMILSHYSTTYIALTLISAAYIVPKVLNFIRKKKVTQSLQLATILYLFLIAIVWNSLLTSTSGNLSAVFGTMLENTDKIFSNELRSEKVLKAVFFDESDTTGRFISLVEEVTERYRTYDDGKSFYENRYDPEFAVKRYPAEYKYSTETIDSIMTVVFHTGIPLVFRFSLILGILIILYKAWKSTISIEYVSLAGTMVLIMLALIFLPSLSVNYNVERLYQQTLILLALPTIWGFYIIKKIPENLITMGIGTMIGLYFLTNIGFVDNAVHGLPAITFNNYGDHYDRYFVRDSEIASLNWLGKQKDPLAVIYADRYATLRIKSYSRTIYFRDVIQEIFPVTVTKNSYVYSSAVNTLKNKTFGNYNDYIVNYYYPKEFLETNKNVIYNNGSTKIYK